MDNLKSLRWHVKYAQKEQNRRLLDHLEENPDNTIGTFVHSGVEWQHDSLIRWSLHYIRELEAEKKVKKTFLQALFRK